MTQTTNSLAMITARLANQFVVNITVIRGPVDITIATLTFSA